MGRSGIAATISWAKASVITDPSLAHQRRIGGETLDQGIGIHFQHAGFVGPVGE